MPNNEFYYLLLVIGAFGTFGVSLAIAYIRYRALLRQPAPIGLQQQPVVRAEASLKRAA